MLRLVCMFLGCDVPIQLVLSSEYEIMIDYKMFHHVLIMSRTTKYVTFYA